MCPFCAMYIEDLEHVLYNCNLVKNFWFEVASIWNKLNSVYFTPSLSNITFGIISHDIEKRNQDINCLLYYGKNCVYKSRAKNILSVKDFQEFINDKCAAHQLQDPVSEKLFEFTLIEEVV